MGVVMMSSGLTSSPIVRYSVCCTILKINERGPRSTIPDSVTETLLRTVLFSPSVMVR